MKKLFRVEWQAPTGFIGHGSWLTDEDRVKSCVEMANKDWPSIKHWVSSLTTSDEKETSQEAQD